MTFFDWGVLLLIYHQLFNQPKEEIIFTEVIPEPEPMVYNLDETEEWYKRICKQGNKKR